MRCTCSWRDNRRRSRCRPIPPGRPGHVAARALKVQGDRPPELPAAGDFDKDQAVSYGAWVKLAKDHLLGAAVARMDDQHDYRGWDLWFEQGRPGAHIVHKWPDDALKVVATNPIKPDQWTHVLVTYDGSGRAGGVKVYVNGQPQPTARRPTNCRTRSARRCR